MTVFYLIFVSYFFSIKPGKASNNKWSELISLNETADPSKFITELWEEQFLPLSYNSLSHISDPWKMGYLFLNIE